MSFFRIIKELKKFPVLLSYFWAIELHLFPLLSRRNLKKYLKSSKAIFSSNKLLPKVKHLLLGNLSTVQNLNRILRFLSFKEFSTYNL